MRVAGGGGVKGLRGDGVEQRIDGIGVGRLQARVSLKPEPRRVLLIYVVVDTGRLYLLPVVARVRNTLPVRAAIPVGRIARRQLPILVEGTAEDRQGGSRRVAVKRKEIPIEGRFRGRQLL